jgi:hypothetical protein
MHTHSYTYIHTHIHRAAAAQMFDQAAVLRKDFKKKEGGGEEVCVKCVV